MELNELASSINAVARITGEFKLRSGATSNVYFDKYQFESAPQLLSAIAVHMTEMVPDGTELLAGLEMGGIAIATAMSLISGIPVVFVRKKAKEYGTCKLAEGPTLRGRRVAIVEDVITSGGQVIISGSELVALGAEISTVLCVIDRESGGREALDEAGYELRSLFTRTQLENS